MENIILKNIPSAETLVTSELVSCQSGQIVSKTLVQNDKVSITVFAFDQGEEISTHASHGDAFVQVLMGTASVTVGSQTFEVNEGESIVMPAEVPHAVSAPTQMKFLLTVVF